MTTVLLLMHFMDVLKESFRGKQFTYRIDSNAPVPKDSLKLWRSRGFEPGTVGVAYVRFEGRDKEYVYPAYFWSE